MEEDLEQVPIVYGSSTGLHSLGALISSLAVSLYHLHDTGRSG